MQSLIWVKSNIKTSNSKQIFLKSSNWFDVICSQVIVREANTMKFTDGLFLEVARDVANCCPEIEFRDHSLNNMCVQPMQNSMMSRWA